MVQSTETTRKKMASTHVIVLSLLFQAFLSSAMQIAPPDEETKLLDFAPEETPAFHEFPILRDRVEKFDQKKIDRLIEWSKEYGATFNAHYYIEDTDQEGYLVARATKDLPRGSPLVVIPPNLIITAQRVAEDGGACPLCDHPDLIHVPPFYEDNPIVMWLVWNKLIGDHSQFEPYISALPQNFSTPLTWSKGYYRWWKPKVQCANIGNNALLLKNEVWSFNLLIRNLLHHSGRSMFGGLTLTVLYTVRERCTTNPSLIRNGADMTMWLMHFEDHTLAMWAAQVYLTRSMQVSASGSRGLFIPAGPGFFRHAWKSDPPNGVVVGELLSKSASHSTKKKHHMFPESGILLPHDVKKGQEVFLTFNKGTPMTDIEFMTQYGIVIKDNPHDAIYPCEIGNIFPLKDGTVLKLIPELVDLEPVRDYINVLSVPTYRRPDDLIWMKRFLDLEIEDLEHFWLAYHTGAPTTVAHERVVISSIAKELKRWMLEYSWLLYKKSVMDRPRSMMFRFQTYRALNIQRLIEKHLLVQWQSILTNGMRHVYAPSFSMTTLNMTERYGDQWPAPFTGVAAETLLAKREDLTPEMLKEMAKQLTRVDGPGEDDFFVDFVLEVGDAKFQPKPLEEVISNEEKYSLEPDNESDTVIYSNGGWVRTPIAVEHVDPTV